MKVLILLIVLITLTNYVNSQLFLTENLNSNVTLTVYPPYIVEGLPFQVDIQCTFKRDTVPPMASVMSILIAHSNETDQPVFNYMASGNGMEGHAHNVSHDVEAISGSIDNNGESKLHMRFKYPETNLIGLYMCEVTGFDQIGKPVSVLSTLNVVTSKITDLFALIHKAESNLSACQNSINTIQSYINNQAGCIEAFMHKVQPTLYTNYYIPIFYNGHDYYVSHALFHFNNTEMQSMCGALGGYLAELDTHDEFNFIRDYLSKLNITNNVYTGATYEQQKGVWINEHNSTSRPSFDWAPGRPATAHCQCFGYNQNWFLEDCYCQFINYEHAYVQYLCEVPRKTC